MKRLLVVEDEEDLRTLVRLQFSLDHDFALDGEAADIPAAVAAASALAPDLVVLDHQLEGPTNGLDGAPMVKLAAPHSRIILFSASEQLRIPATRSPAIDAFLLKTDVHQLVPLARQLLHLD